MATPTHERPCAAPGLKSFRYRGPLGWVMIGAKDEADALREAERSIEGRADVGQLEAWADDVGAYIGRLRPFEGAKRAAFWARLLGVMARAHYTDGEATVTITARRPILFARGVVAVMVEGWDNATAILRDEWERQAWALSEAYQPGDRLRDFKVTERGVMGRYVTLEAEGPTPGSSPRDPKGRRLWVHENGVQRYWCEAANLMPEDSPAWGRW